MAVGGDEGWLCRDEMGVGIYKLRPPFLGLLNVYLKGMRMVFCKVVCEGKDALV